MEEENHVTKEAKLPRIKKTSNLRKEDKLHSQTQPNLSFIFIKQVTGSHHAVVWPPDQVLQYISY